MFLAFSLSNGHSQVATCATCTWDPNNVNKIITGSELGELCFWSSNDGKLIKKLILPENDDVMCIKSSKKNPHFVYVSAGSKISILDLRFLINGGESVVDVLDFADDEINEISLNNDENLLATAEDSGFIKVFDLKAKKVLKTLRKHENICSGVSFRPNRNGELLSSSFDQKLIQWDFMKSRSFCIMNIKEVGSQPDELESYVVSPPFIHSLSINNSGSLVACSTEDALVQVFDGTKRILRHVKTLRRHNKAVAQVHFPRFSEDLLVSAGNDNLLCLWRISNTSSNEDYSRMNGHHSNLSIHANNNNNDNELPNNNAQNIINNASSSSSTNNNARNIINNASSSSSTNERTPLWQMTHNESFNWISSGTNGNSKFIIAVDNSPNPLLFSFSE